MKQGKLKAIAASDASGGVILMMAAVAAMLAANSPVAALYESFVATAHLAINDFLMAIFFLLAGLEIKRECMVGALSSRARAALPLIAAICGMAVPALVYLGIVGGDAGAMRGWAIPSATDIAFALGVLALASSRVPAALKVLLMAIAVMDDLGAILVIAFFYTGGVAWVPLAGAAAASAVLVALNRMKVLAYTPYIAVGAVLWFALLKAGVHPTIGGVILGFCIPMPKVEKLEHALKGPVTFGILPLFAFANAGVSLAGLGLGDMLHPVTLAIAAGLFIGKQVGIFGAIWLMVKAGICALPQGVNWRHIYGLSLLCGIGFTMALFIGGLAFTDPAMGVYVRMGVIGGSILSGLLGYTVLSFAGSRLHKGL